MKTTRISISILSLALLCLTISLAGCKRELAIEQPDTFGPAPTEEPAVGTIRMGDEDGVKAPTK